MPDTELTAAVLAAQRGDERAFVHVFRAVHPRLLGYVRTIVAESDAEDVTSEAWLHISRDLGRFRGDADRFRGWANRIARNRALDHLRARGRRPMDLVDDTSLIERAGPGDTAEEALAAVGTARTFALLGRLPREQAEAVALRSVMGLDARRAAGVLGSRPGAVRTATHRGLRRLAELMEDGEVRTRQPRRTGAGRRPPAAAVPATAGTGPSGR
ncbi:sigma-70 family RNA polymerase sigma factor [Streptomyces alkaliphilus]|uniref:Sigma-70 family RNA polymerase sigma factor n=1 Tax=Streptomyces alkaliphilus TaxID=1472722 RepID=A0A7W3Y438_9ACTN|nr:RNA polymerase sigma factor [Streptomyces alkaliphilus]MBB0247258.1 sigma-70 family RNA polymerase sigma factor [Streptomyces alkaliphilus]